jgi:S-adenosylmethionine decarboxylase
LEKEDFLAEGEHVIADLWDCENNILNDPEKIKELLRIASLESGATPIKYLDHKFEPQGVTGIWILSESHCSVHTYPEIGYGHFDIFTCGSTCKPEAGIDLIIKILRPKIKKISKISRGLLDE